MISDDTTTPPEPKRRAKGAKASAEAASPPPVPQQAHPAPAKEPRHVSPRVLRVALGVSVALNLLVAGLVLGSLYHMGGRDGRPEMARDLAFGPFGESLRPEDRRALRSYLQARAPELRSANAQRGRDIAAVQTALRADPFDPVAFAAAITAMRSRLEGQLALGFDGLSAVVMAMPDAERRALADRLDRGLRRDAQGGEDRRQDRPEQRD